MDDPFDRGRWPLPRLAVELDDLAVRTEPPGGDVAVDAADWALDQLADGATPAELCEAALWVGLRRGRSEGRGPRGLVTHSVLAAASCRAVGSPLAAVQHVAYTLGAYRGGVNDEREGPSVLAWFEPHSGAPDPVLAFTDAAASGETELADHCWLAAAAADPLAAEQALVAAGAAGYHLNEHKLVLPAQLRAWIGADAPLDPVLFRAAARYAGNHLQDPARSEERRADAAALAMALDDGALDDGALDDGALDGGGAGSAGHEPDLERISVVATGIARTAPRDLAPLLLGSLGDGLAPEDLVHAVALVTAARYAATPGGRGGPVGALHAGTGTSAVRACLARATDPELRYELALCATESPHLAELAPVEELSVPPSDDGGLEDLLDALDSGDSDMAAEAASAVPPGDADAVGTAWSAVFDAAARDQWMLLHAVKHAVAMREDFGSSDHPARIWFLAAAARTAAYASLREQPVAERVERRLGRAGS